MRLIKKIAFNVGIMAMFVGRMWGQVPAPTTISLAEQPLPIVTQIGTSFSGTAGNNTYCYWVVAEYAIGNAAISAPSCRGGVGTGTVTVTWQAPATVNALNYSLGYDVIRTTSNVFNQSCTACLLTNSTTGLSTTDTLGTLAAGYTINQYGLSNAVTSIDNTSTGNALMYTNQNGVRYPSDNRWGNTLPTYCNVGDSFYLVGTGPYFCSTANTFVSITPGTSGLTTVGSVPYVISTGVLGQDPTKFFWDATNKRLGIGTNSPTHALQVVGQINIPDSNSYIWGAGTSYISGSSVSNFLTFNTAVTERMRITSTGNVGIGAAIPGATLHVKSASNEILSDATTGDATISTAIAGVRKWSFYNQGPGNNLWFYDWTNSVSRLTVQPGTANAMTILSSGNVGIGTPTPGDLLHIKGNAARYAVQDNNSGVPSYFGVDANGDALLQLYDISGNEDIRLYAVLNGNNWINNGGNFGIGTITPATKLQVVGGKILLDNAQAIQFKDSAGNAISILNVNSGDNVTLSTPSGGDLYLNQSSYLVVKSNGSVGIGAVSPSNKLTVVGAMSVGSATYNTVAPTNGMIIEGNVGIGTTAPGIKLDVLGSARVYNSAADAAILIGADQVDANNAKISYNRGTGMLDITPRSTFATNLIGRLKFSITNSTGANSVLLGANSPATITTAPYTWITVTTSDGTTGFMPIWK